MESPVATILSINNGVATVSVSRSVACARCAAGKGCGAGLLGSKSGAATLDIPLPGSMHLRVGEQVTLALSPDSLLRASFLAYGLPLAGVVVALVLGRFIAGPLTDASAIGLAVTGLAAGLVIGRKRIGRDRCLEQFVPTIAGRASVPAP